MFVFGSQSHLVKIVKWSLMKGARDRSDRRNCAWNSDLPIPLSVVRSHRLS